MRARGKEKVNGKLNYLDRYSLGLALGRHLIKNGATNSAVRR
jgi:hypothetical protein